MAGETANLLMSMVNNDYVKSIIIFFFFMVLAFVFLSIVKTILSSWARRSMTKVDDLIIEKLEVPVSLFVAVAGAKFALLPLTFSNGVRYVVGHTLNSVLIIIATYIAIKIVTIIIKEMGRKMHHLQTVEMRTVFPLIQRFTNIFLGMLGFLFIMVEWQVEVGPFLASLGIIGLGISFALKDSLANVFGGISLIMDKNFRVGDVVKLETGESGQVLEIGLRSTKIRTWDNEAVIIPNNILSNMRITNMAKPDLSVRITLDIGVDYNSDPDKVRKVLFDAISAMKGVMPEPKPIIRFIKMGDFSLQFKVYFWIDNYLDRFGMEDKSTTDVWYALKKAGIGIPFPTRTLFMKNAVGKRKKKTAKRKKKK